MYNIYYLLSNKALFFQQDKLFVNPLCPDILSIKPLTIHCLCNVTITYQHVLVWNVCVYVCGAPASGSHTHTSSQVSVLLAAEQRGCVTVCSALCSRLSFHELAAN